MKTIAMVAACTAQCSCRSPGWIMQMCLLEKETSLPLCLVIKLYACSVHFN